MKVQTSLNSPQRNNLRNKTRAWRNIVQQLRRLAALPEDQSFFTVPMSPIPELQFQWNQGPLLAPVGTCMHMTPIYIHMNKHTKK